MVYDMYTLQFINSCMYYSSDEQAQVENKGVHISNPKKPMLPPKNKSSMLTSHMHCCAIIMILQDMVLL